MASRRRFLRSATSLVALPALESLGFRRSVRAADPSPPPKRMVFLGIGFGVTQETWLPKLDVVGSGYPLPEGSLRWPAIRTTSRWCRAAPTGLPTIRTAAARFGSPAAILRLGW